LKAAKIKINYEILKESLLLSTRVKNANQNSSKAGKSHPLKLKRDGEENLNKTDNQY